MTGSRASSIPRRTTLRDESMSLTRRTLLAAGALLASAGAALAFPDRPVQIIVPSAAGGGTDTVVRIFAAGFEKELGVPVNVVNRAAATASPATARSRTPRPTATPLA